MCVPPQPLFLALREGREEVIAALLAAGAAPIDVPEEGLPESDDDGGDIGRALEEVLRISRLRGMEGEEPTEFPDVDPEEEEDGDEDVEDGEGK